MNKFHLLLLSFFLTFGSLSFAGDAKDPKHKGRMYLAWGYNKDWFSRSDLHFKNYDGDYDFTVYDVKAHDAPNFNKVFRSNISIPQFIYRVGYMFPNHPNTGIEVGFDHAKYIMTQDQVAHVEGQIEETWVNKDTVLSTGFLRFEHTNGANFLMVSLVKRAKIFSNASGHSEIFGVFKPGAGIVIPQSEVAIFGKDQNNVYHIAGYVCGIDADIRYEYLQHYVLETGLKYVYANYLDVLSVDNARANHDFFCFEWLISIAYQFRI